MDQLKLLRLEVIGIWFTGFATFLAVVLALFLQRYSERRQRPKLCVQYDTNDKSDNRYLPPGPAGTGAEREELWTRLRVKNISNTPAKDVEVRFIGVESAGVRVNRPSWSFKVSNFDAVSIRIPPKFTQYFDLTYVKNELTTREDLSCYLVIVGGGPRPWPDEKARIEQAEKDNKLEIGSRHDLFFAVVSSNADANYYRMAINVRVRKAEDPPPDKLLGEAYLRSRVEVVPPSSFTPEEAFSQK